MKIDKFKIVEAIEPVVGTNAVTGTYISLKNVVKCRVVVQIAQSSSATAAITIERATAVAGTGSVAIATAVPIWVNLDTAASDVLATATAAVSYTTDAGVKNKIVVFVIDPVALGDTYDCITVKIGASATGTLYSALYLLELRYSAAVVITD